jgi:hypothetical protein
MNPNRNAIVMMAVTFCHLQSRSLRELAARAFADGYFPDTMTLGQVKDRFRHALDGSTAFQKLTVDGETHYRTV